MGKKKKRITGTEVVTGIRQLVWSEVKYAIYKNHITKLYEFYTDGINEESFPTFDKAYKHSMKVRGLKY